MTSHGKKILDELIEDLKRFPETPERVRWIKEAETIKRYEVPPDNKSIGGAAYRD